MSEVRYFKIDNFQQELTAYLKQCSAWYVTAMCPVCTTGDGGFTSGIFEHVVSKYRIDADVIRHTFEGNQTYRNGNVYRIYPHVSWVHFNGGTNGHNTEPEMIIIEKNNIGNKWDIGLTLR